VSTDDSGLPPARRRIALFAVYCAIALSTLSITGITVALPLIADDVSVPAGDVVALVSWFQVTMLAAVLPFAALGERVGYRRVFLAGLAAIAVASLVCAQASSFESLLAGRVLQGLGAAAVSSVNPAILRLSVPASRLGAIIGTNAVVVAVCSAAGPSVAALVLSLGSWRWLFVLNLPWACLAFAMGWATPSAAGHAKGGFDFAGALLNAATFVLLGSGLGMLASHGATGVPVLLGGFALAMVFVLQQRRRERPLLPLDLLQLPLVRWTVAASVCAFASQVASMVALPFVLHVGMGLDLLTTGLAMMLWPVAVGVMAPAAARLEFRIPTALLCATGGFTMAAGLLVLWLLSGTTQLVPIAIAIVLCGIGFGLFQTPNNRSMITATPRERSGGAGGLQGTARLLGQMLGATSVAMVFQLHPAGPAVAGADALLVAGAFAVGCGAFSLARRGARSGILRP
jgi:DHA2 family multidrug resistance protein-like MFS transporter